MKAPDWRALAEVAHLPVEGDVIVIQFDENGRSHRVRIESGTDGFRVWAVVVAAPQRLGRNDIDIRAWRRNAATDLVGFRTDHRGRLIGEAWIPYAGITASEFAAYVCATAEASDRFEHLLTGRDLE